MENGMQSSRVAMPPSKRGDRASMATAWKPRSWPAWAAPSAYSAASIRPSLVAGPRMRKLSAADPQYRRSQSMLASKPPLAHTTARAAIRSGSPASPPETSTAVHRFPVNSSPSAVRSYQTVTPAAAAVRW